MCAVDWMRSSGVAQRMLDDVCQAVEATVARLVGNDGDTARGVLEGYPRVISCCDHLKFDALAQALAYLIVHVPDRYCRMFQVLERLLVDGRLPMGRSDSFAAIDRGRAGAGHFRRAQLLCRARSLRQAARPLVAGFHAWP